MRPFYSDDPIKEEKRFSEISAVTKTSVPELKRLHLESRILAAAGRLDINFGRYCIALSEAGIKKKFNLYESSAMLAARLSE